MELVSKYFVLSIFLYLFLGLHLLVLRLQLFVNIASVVSTGSVAVFGPFCKAEPAKPVRTFLASNVITPLILFNQRGAFGTRFRIGLEPL